MYSVVNEVLLESRWLERLEETNFENNTVMHHIFVHFIFPSIGLNDGLDQRLIYETIAVATMIIIYKTMHRLSCQNIPFRSKFNCF